MRACESLSVSEVGNWKENDQTVLVKEQDHQIGSPGPSTTQHEYSCAPEITGSIVKAESERPKKVGGK